MAQMVGDGWNVECVANGLPTVIDLAIKNDGTVYYIIDENSDPSDPMDSILYMLPKDGSSAVVIGTSDGSTVLNVEANGNMVYTYVSTGEDNKLRLLSDDTMNEVLLENADDLQGNYFAVTDDQGEIIAILYTKTKNLEGDTAACSVIYGIFRDENGAWGNPVVVFDFDTDNFYVSSFDAILMEDGALLLSMSVNDKNNQTLGEFTKIYDLNSENLEANYEINYRDKTVTFAVTNNGAMPATIYCTYYEKSGILNRVVAASGETVTFTVSLISNSVLTLKTDNQVLGFYEISLDYTDLQVMGKQIVIGENNMLLLAIKNLGNMEARDILIKVYQGIDEGATLLTTFPIEKLDGNDMLYFEMVLDTLILRNGSDILTVVVESGSWDEYDDNDTMITYLSEITQGIGGVMDPVLSQYKIQYFRGQSENVRIRVICAKVMLLS
jgi:antitoxin component YwqK of YwqJK toxin-antitoxin module